MTTPINNFDDILNAMDADPRLAEAVRDRILSRELLELPTVVQGLSNRVDAVSNRLEVVSGNVETLASQVETLTSLVETLISLVETLTGHFATLSSQFQALTETIQQFIGEQRAFNERIDRTIAELKQSHEELRATSDALRISNDELRIANRNAVKRMDRMEQDSSILKNFSTETAARRYVESVADDMGLTYVRTLTTKELMDMTEGRLSRSVRRSFVRADLIMEALEDNGPCYAAVEISYTVDARDTSRAIRNAGYITQFTGVTCYPGVVGVRRDWESEALVEAGTVRWSEVEDWYASTEVEF